jgi:AbrB family looped-hinge helix DNA binding protein
MVHFQVLDSLPIGKDTMDGKEDMPTSTLTSKGQITIPKEVRDQLHLKTGSRLEFVVDPSGRVIMQPLNSNFRALRGDDPLETKAAFLYRRNERSDRPRLFAHMRDAN